MIRAPLALPAAILAATVLPAAATAREEAPYALTAFGGPLLDNTWEQVFVEPWALDIEDSALLGVATSGRIAQPLDGLSIELEGQIVRHLHGHTHWEVNAPVVTARWSRIPWSGHVDTSAAFGLGLSMASKTPALEIANEGGSRAVMAYWMIEVDTALPAEGWRLVGRLHHRSTAYGLFGDEGGANALVLGVRRQF